MTWFYANVVLKYIFNKKTMGLLPTFALAKREGVVSFLN
jgi:hypothetical protein